MARSAPLCWLGLPLAPTWQWPVGWLVLWVLGFSPVLLDRHHFGQSTRSDGTRYSASSFARAHSAPSGPRRLSCCFKVAAFGKAPPPKARGRQSPSLVAARSSRDRREAWYQSASVRRCVQSRTLCRIGGPLSFQGHFPPKSIWSQVHLCATMCEHFVPMSLYEEFQESMQLSSDVAGLLLPRLEISWPLPRLRLGLV